MVYAIEFITLREQKIASINCHGSSNLLVKFGFGFFESKIKIDKNGFKFGMIYLILKKYIIV